VPSATKRGYARLLACTIRCCCGICPRQGEIAFERDLADHGKRVSRALRGALPALSQAECAMFLRAMAATVAGLWPMRRANDAAALAHILRAQLQATAIAPAVS